MKLRSKLDEYGRIIEDELSFKFFGGGGKGGGGSSTTYVPTYTAPQAAPKPAEAVTQDTAVTPEEEAKKMKEAQKVGAKSLQIPVMGATNSASNTTVGTV